MKYFHGRVSDRKKSMRVVSFELKLRSEKDIAQTEKKTIVLSNCGIKENSYEALSGGDGIEIIASSRTKVLPTPKKLKVDTGDVCTC